MSAVEFARLAVSQDRYAEREPAEEPAPTEANTVVLPYKMIDRMILERCIESMLSRMFASVTLQAVVLDNLHEEAASLRKTSQRLRCSVHKETAECRFIQLKKIYDLNQKSF